MRGRLRKWAVIILIKILNNLFQYISKQQSVHLQRGWIIAHCLWPFSFFEKLETQDRQIPDRLPTNSWSWSFWLRLILNFFLDCQEYLNTGRWWTCSNERPGITEIYFKMIPRVQLHLDMIIRKRHLGSIWKRTWVISKIFEMNQERIFSIERDQITHSKFVIIVTAFQRFHKIEIHELLFFHRT